jgi:hypothetical protein
VGRTRWGAFAALAVVVAGCGGATASTDGSTGARTEDVAEPGDPVEVGPPAGAAPEAGPDTAADDVEVTAAGTCGELHAAVLSHLDVVRARADEALVGTSLEAVITEQLAQGVPLPPEIAFLASLTPVRPYGGVAGASAEARYVALGCGPDDEYPAIAAHLGVPADASEAELQAAFELDAASAGDGVTLGLVRRLLEGGADRDDAAVLVAAMEEAVAAQEAVRDATGAYTEEVGDLLAAGLPAEYDDVDGVFLLVLAADADRYCMTAAGDRGVAYVESHDATPVVGSRPDPADWCAATFGELD